MMMSALLIGISTAHAATRIQTWNTPHGARVLFVETHTIPVLDLSVEFDAGSRRDAEGKSGLAVLTNSLLARGAHMSTGSPSESALSEEQILDTFADTGAQRGSSVTMDRAGVSLRTLSNPEESNKAIFVLSRILAHPSFPAELVERDKARAISGVKEELTQPDAIAGRAFKNAIYLNHPYAKSPTPESLEAITREDIVHFHRTHYVANRAVIVIVGDADRARAESIANELSSRLSVADQALPALPAIPPGQSKEERIAHPATQSHILIGMTALRRDDPDFFPLMVGNYTLGGGGFASRLMQDVREKRGLVYGVGSAFIPLLQEGPFQIGLQTKQAQTKEALGIVRETLADFMKTGQTEAELQAAKDYLIQSFPLRIDNNRKIMGQIAAIGYYNLPLDYLDTWTQKIKKVTAGDVKAAFHRKVHQEQLTTVIVGE